MGRGRGGSHAAASGGQRSTRAAHGSARRLREIIAEDLVRIDDERLAFVTVTAIDVDPS